jgi:hypothetical protein
MAKGSVGATARTLRPFAFFFAMKPAIKAVWHDLGGGPLKGNRGVAWWRGGDGLSISLDDERGGWYDFACNQGGGIIDLVQTVLGIDRREAAAWCRQRYGWPEGRQPLTAAERQGFARRRKQAERRADDLTKWRRDLLDELLMRRNSNYKLERDASAWARANLGNPELSDSPLWDAVWAHARDDQKGDEIQTEIDGLERMTPTELMHYRSQGRAVCSPFVRVYGRVGWLCQVPMDQ